MKINKFFDEDGKELFEFKIDICKLPSNEIIYIAESKEEAIQLFLESNKDLTNNDISIKLNQQGGK